MSDDEDNVPYFAPPFEECQMPPTGSVSQAELTDLEDEALLAVHDPQVLIQLLEKRLEIIEKALRAKGIYLPKP